MRVAIGAKQGIAAAVASVMLLACVAPVPAEFILDDFTLPGDGLFEDEQELWYANGIRQLGVFCICYDQPVTLTMDSHTVNPSVLTMVAGPIPDNHLLGRYGSLDIGHNYFPGYFDLTQNGAYNAFRLDFAFARGPSQVRNIRMKTTGWQHTAVGPLPITEEPFSVVVPFNIFRNRNNVPPTNEFSNSQRFSIQFQTTGNGWSGFPQPQPEHLGWELGLDRISLIYVPEPPVEWHVILLISLTLTLRRSRSF